MKTLVKVLDKCIIALNAVNIISLSLIVFCAVLLLWYYYPEETNLYICLPIALFTLFGFYRFRNRVKFPAIPDRHFLLWLVGITLCAEVLYILTEMYYPLRYTSDHLIVKESAIYISGHSCFPPEQDYYFHMFPNNVNITILSGYIYRMFGTWKAVEIFGSLLVNLSILTSTLTVRNLTRSNSTAIVALLLGHFYIGLCFHSFIPYTHNFGILFPILCLYFYTSSMSRAIKTVLIIATAAIGNEMKVTTLIPFIAIAFYEFIDFLKKPQIKIAVIAIMSIIVCFGGCKIVRNSIYKSIDYQHDETIATTMPFFLMMGQSTETGGRSDGSSYALNEKIAGHSKAERDSLFMSIALQRFTDRELVGNLKFFGNKICMSWSDGTMSDHKTKYHNPTMQKLSVLYSFPRQYVLYLLLSLMLLAPFVVKSRRIYPFILSITGVFVYQFFFESESRYIFMYTPIMIAISVTTLYCLMKSKHMQGAAEKESVFLAFDSLKKSK